jgi:hypothetical protein
MTAKEIDSQFDELTKSLTTAVKAAPTFERKLLLKWLTIFTVLYSQPKHRRIEYVSDVRKMDRLAESCISDLRRLVRNR